MNKQKPIDVFMDLILSAWSTREPFWRLIDKMSPDRRSILKELKSDDIKDHNWMFRPKT